MNIITNEPKHRSIKCFHCKQTLDRNTEPFDEHSKKFYHKECFAIKHSDIQARNELYDYICKLQEIPYPNGYILKQVKGYQETHGYTIRGMLTTLRFAHEVVGVPVKKDVGIGIVEYYYKKAIEHYTNLHNIRQKNLIIEYDNNEEIVYTKPPEARKKKMIDIAEL